jgi:hypothetical protein
MKPKSQNDGTTKLEKVPFSVLVKADRELADFRHDYASRPARDRIGFS